MPPLALNLQEKRCVGAVWRPKGEGPCLLLTGKGEGTASQEGGGEGR